MSIALVTRNRPQSLQRTLESLRGQSVQPEEVIVSDDSDPARAAGIQRMAARYGCRYAEGPRRGLYANRNAAALACLGTHIRMMDDDHTFPEGHFASCTRAVQDDPDAVWIFGECLPGSEGAGKQHNCPGQLHPRGFSISPPAGRRMWAIADGAAVYPRRIFDEGNRLYDRFVFGASYLEWGSRLHWLGYDIRHLSSTYVIHHVEGRSYNDEFTNAASRLFAGLSHSFLYQPTVRNRLSTVMEMGVVCLRLRRTGVYAVVAAGGAYWEHRRMMTANETIHAPANTLNDHAHD